ncbi:motility associated factor glycosyltransferase family protein [Campylobacter coli]|uniref:motility associated factor glycosyltransferase family protein n=1 Tax=Campylobacter coli TaxID=195 RepID=UPI000931FD6B|nr:motility associated factor glycosyltransferase family protein [Campylobacter coli]
MKTTDIFEKNLLSLSGKEYENLVKKLKKIKESKKFSPLFDAKDPLNLNIIENSTKEKIYQNPLKELESKIELIQEKYLKYPVLFFYGIGNGFLYKALLQNPHFKRIIVFEKEIELIFLALNLADFTQELKKGRLIIVLSSEMDDAKASSLFSLPEINLLFKSYFLDLHSDFYEKYSKDIIKINNINKNMIIYASLRQGNDPKDALQGVDQFVRHIPHMITHPSLSELIKKRYKKAKNAIIVATGPSLQKQIPLLKKYHKKASIFCLDASYSILHENDIKPDYVLSLERVVATSEFFNNDFKEFDKDILFILLTLTHPQTIKYLEANKRSYILTPRALPFSKSIKHLKDFSSLNGMSVAHMALILAYRLGHENVILIGQDLAFGKDGASHSKGYGRDEELAKKETQALPQTKVKAYGGKGLVKTTKIWELFIKVFETLTTTINAQKNYTVYNATEGGARIGGTIEKPFKELCENLLDKELKKPLTKVNKLSRKEQNLLLLKSYKQIKTFIKRSEKIAKDLRKTGKQIRNLTREIKQKYKLEQISKNIDEIKTKLASSNYAYLAEVLGPSIYHAESSLGELYLQNISNESDKQNKLIAWIYAHEAWIDEVHNLIILQNGILKSAIIPLRDMVEKRKLV